MSIEEGPTPAEVDALYEELNRDAEASGYHLNPDSDFTRALVESLIVNERRYGYRCCPCRLSSGDKEKDLDIICPCDYRDADLGEWGACYCALYVSDDVLAGDRELEPIPERRASEEERAASGAAGSPGKASSGAFGRELAVPVWRCRVCGYLCARDAPPDSCPICKAKKERFERFV